MQETVYLLHERGHGGTSTLEVQRRAGVSRGALLHHFGSRAELILAAVDYLARQRVAEVLGLKRDPNAGLPRVEWAVQVLWSTFEGPLFSASLQLWLAARHDSELRAAVLQHERVVGRLIRVVAANLFGVADEEPAGFAIALDQLLDAMRGADLRLLGAHGDSGALLRTWSRHMRQAMRTHERDTHAPCEPEKAGSHKPRGQESSRAS